MTGLAETLFSSVQRPLVCGIVNVTPDSFSDGGKFNDPQQATQHGLALVEQGADIIDIGGESTRPGSDPISVTQELDRVLPVISAIRQRSNALISIDTMKPEVATKAVKAGANIWNDVSALRHEQTSLSTAAKLRCPVILMHMQGLPKTMQDQPSYGDVFTEISEFLLLRIQAALSAGVEQKNIIIDPGIGFGKTCSDNLKLSAKLDKLQRITKCPLMLGASRKRLIGELDNNANSNDRLGGSLAFVAAAYYQGLAIIRVHDVRETVQMLKVLKAIKANG